MPERRDGRTTLAADIAVGLLAGLVATKVNGWAQQALYRPMPASIKGHEERVRPEPSSRVAARKIGAGLGYRLDERQLRLATLTVHYGVGLAWGPVYGLLRRHARMGPLGAAVVTGAAMSLLMDELLVPVLGFSAPNRAFPATTHVSCLAAERCWDQARWAVEAYAWRFEDLERVPEAGGTT